MDAVLATHGPRRPRPLRRRSAHRVFQGPEGRRDVNAWTWWRASRQGAGALPWFRSVVLVIIATLAWAGLSIAVEVANPAPDTTLVILLGSVGLTGILASRSSHPLKVVAIALGTGLGIVVSAPVAIEPEGHDPGEVAVVSALAAVLVLVIGGLLYLRTHVRVTFSQETREAAFWSIVLGIAIVVGAGFALVIAGSVAGAAPRPLSAPASVLLYGGAVVVLFGTFLGMAAVSDRIRLPDDAEVPAGLAVPFLVTLLWCLFIGLAFGE